MAPTRSGGRHIERFARTMAAVARSAKNKKARALRARAEIHTIGGWVEETVEILPASLGAAQHIFQKVLQSRDNPQ